MSDGIYEVIAERDMEETEKPERVVVNGDNKPRLVKFTSRTFKSFKDYRVRRAIEKYNKRYQELKENLDEAERVQERINNGDRSVDEDRKEYALYDAERAAQKLAKLGTKLLNAEGVFKVVRKNTSVRPRKIKVPFKMLRGIVNKLDTVRGWNRTRKVRKELKKNLPDRTERAVRQYVDTAFGTINKDDSKLNSLSEQIVEKLSAVNIHTFVPGYGALEDEIKKVRTAPSELPPIEKTTEETKPASVLPLEAAKPELPVKTVEKSKVDKPHLVTAALTEKPASFITPKTRDEDMVKRYEAIAGLYEQRIRLREKASRIKNEVLRNKIEAYIEHIDKEASRLISGGVPKPSKVNLAREEELNSKAKLASSNIIGAKTKGEEGVLSDVVEDVTGVTRGYKVEEHRHTLDGKSTGMQLETVFNGSHERVLDEAARLADKILAKKGFSSSLKPIAVD